MHRFISLFLFVAFPFCLQGQDSLLAKNVTDTTIVTDSLGKDTITRKILPLVARPSTIMGANRAAKSRAGYFFVGIGVFLMFGLLRYAYHKYIDALLTTLARSTLWRLSANERLWQNVSQRWFFLIIYFLSAGYVVGCVIDAYGLTTMDEFSCWMLGSALAVGAFFTKFLILQSVALVFRFNKLAKAFFRHIMVINQIMGIILLPICGILLILPEILATIFLYLAMGILIISMIFKYLVNMAYVRNLRKVNYVHFIVYLCTLEFIPLAVLVRYAYDGFGV